MARVGKRLPGGRRARGKGHWPVRPAPKALDRPDVRLPDDGDGDGDRKIVGVRTDSEAQGDGSLVET